jgi:nucleoside-diphosphate-sugar epimerase
MKDTTMTERNPILITGVGGQIGGVSRLMVDMLLEQGHPVRAFVRRDDERAQSLREAGPRSSSVTCSNSRTWPPR